MNDYKRIARVIEYLDEHYTDQPDLPMLAEHVGLSPFHFHRLFSAWAGITPKDFVECLTLNHAKELLRQGESVLDAALATGLSGPGRLHDLCIKLEAASPGEIKSGGAGCEIRFGFAKTPFGNWLAAENSKGICHVGFVEQRTSAASATLYESWPEAEFTRDDSVAARLAALVFENSKPVTSRPALRAFVRGTEFQVRVWRALLQVPSGALVSYGRLASLVGHPRASRAVGSAVGQNPLAYLIPCHRVIRETGVVKGYRWGDTRKRALLAWESAKTANIRNVAML
ncbi:MAG: methylated-DNA--[protein]-cysteine S-methyltransferase [Verrucomicrobiales bacterium]|nr:methylated-DNA--[protein]-cysteine S-methyltransferase [Verrucomicrobiales bacterium]